MTRLVERMPDDVRCRVIVAAAHARFGFVNSIRDGSPLDANGEPIPWYTYSAIEYLQQLDFSEKSIFEFGAGNSTLFWSRRARRVVCVESDDHWLQRVRSRATPSRVEFHFATERDAYLGAFLNHSETFDVVVVDGRFRRKCVEAAIQKIQPGGLIILDNSDRYPRTSEKLREAGYLQVDMSGFGPLNTYTWTTSFFFHRQCDFRPKRGIQPQASIGSLGHIADDDHDDNNNQGEETIDR